MRSLQNINKNFYFSIVIKISKNSFKKEIFVKDTFKVNPVNAN